jgi:hypothetical protein
MENGTDIEPIDIIQPSHFTKLTRRVRLHPPMPVVHVNDYHVSCWDCSPGYKRKIGLDISFCSHLHLLSLDPV